jgi:lipoate---protein ligase
MRLRVLDFGHVPALRSQAIYHGIAHTIEAGSDPVLTLVNPIAPYVCVGVHQDVVEGSRRGFCKERKACRSSDAMSAAARSTSTATRCSSTSSSRTPRRRKHAANLYPLFIEPVVRTYHELGVDAQYRPINDIQVNGRKIGGTGAASSAKRP